jgi:hypothetical protein
MLKKPFRVQGSKGQGSKGQGAGDKKKMNIEHRTSNIEF